MNSIGGVFNRKSRVALFQALGLFLAQTLNRDVFDLPLFWNYILYYAPQSFFFDI